MMISNLSSSSRSILQPSLYYFIRSFFHSRHRPASVSQQGSVCIIPNTNYFVQRSDPQSINIKSTSRTSSLRSSTNLRTSTQPTTDDRRYRTRVLLSCFTTRLALRGQDCSRTGNVYIQRDMSLRIAIEPTASAQKWRTIHCGKNLEGLGGTDAVPFFAPKTFDTLFSTTTTTRLEHLISGSQLVP